MTNHNSLANALEDRVLRGPGKTDPALRQRVAARACGGPPIESPYDELAQGIGEAAPRTTDERVGAVVTAAGGQKAAFEIIVAAAVGAGLLRRARAIEACTAARNATL